ncbi:MAG: CHASE2 domain-containing protein [Chthoniobacterales bacterium]|nr:CHASE2 domain-containing protein [Chthoniobacterales bacterium]
MQLPTPWLMLVVLLLGLLFLREPRAQHLDDGFLRWLLRQTYPAAAAVPLTVVEIGADINTTDPKEEATAARPAAISPLEIALFLQATMEFHPEVIAFENILKWRDRDRDQEQVFLDQAMRVPKLLLAAELTTTPDLDVQGREIEGFTQVRGRRGDLAEFSGIGRQPGEDMRLISTLSFVNLPDEVSSDVRVPLLFLYRGEVIPSFPLQAVLLWLRVTPAEVKIELGSHITLPDGRKIPIASDGSMLIHPNAAKNARRVSLNELLLATQQRDAGKPIPPEFADLHDNLVLARTPANPVSPPDIFAATIAAIQGNAYPRRIPKWFDAALLFAAVASIGLIRRFDAVDLVLSGIAYTAAYCLVALSLLTRWQIWLPACVPVGAVWLVILLVVILRASHHPARAASSMIPPAIA